MNNDAVINALYGVFGVIGTIAIILVVPFFKDLIFKIFDSRLNIKISKVLSDYNAKNDTKIHTSKALFDLEQQAINHALSIIGKLVYITIETGGTVIKNVKLNKTIHSNREYYVKQMRLLLDILTKYKTESVLSSIYLPEEIDNTIQQIFGGYLKLYCTISQCISENNIKELNSYFDNFIIKIDEDNKRLKKIIREHYNNIKIV